MSYRVAEKRTLLVGSQKIASGRTIPSALAKQIGKKGIESLLRDGAIVEKNEKKKAAEKEILSYDSLESLTREELFLKAEELEIDLPTQSSKQNLIEAIRSAE